MENDKIFAPLAQANANILANTKFLSACFAGAVSGVLGLQKQYGFALFAMSSILTAFAIYGIQIRGKAPKSTGEQYVPGGLWEILNPGQENVFSFLLLWTLLYGLVHVYD